MTILTNPRHEHFAQAVAAGKSADQSYRDAGYKPSRQHGARLATKGDIRARVAEIQARTARQAEVTLERLLAEAEAARAAAMAAGQYSAAVAAIREKGILSGLRVERRERTNRPVEEITDAELDAIIARGDDLERKDESIN